MLKIPKDQPAHSATREEIVAAIREASKRAPSAIKRLRLETIAHWAVVFVAAAAAIAVAYVLFSTLK